MMPKKAFQQKLSICPRGSGGLRTTDRLQLVCRHCGERREGERAGEGHAEHVLHANSSTLHQLRHTRIRERAIATDTYDHGSAPRAVLERGGGMTLGCIAVCSRRCPSASHHLVPSLSLPGLPLPLSTPFLSCQRSPRTFPVRGGGSEGAKFGSCGCFVVPPPQPWSIHREHTQGSGPAIQPHNL